MLGMARTGIAAANALVARGFDVLLSDVKSKAQLSDALAQLDPKVTVVAGSNHVRENDLVVISPGIRPGSPAFELAHKTGREVISDVELFYRMSPAEMLCVTGTDGKSTTTALLDQLLVDGGRNTFVGGNIGIGLMSGLDHIDQSSAVVVEVSCFQLIHCPTLRPKIAVLTNIAEDHIDYHGSFEAYQTAKRQLLINLQSTDTAVLNADDPHITAWQLHSAPQQLWFSRKKPVKQGTWVDDGWLCWTAKPTETQRVVAVDDIAIVGPHNLENALAASAAALAFGISPKSVAHTLRTFNGLEHRIERVLEINSVTFFNDSKATNPHSAMAGLAAFGDRPVTAICGGSEKGSDFGELGHVLNENLTAVVLIGESAPRIEAVINPSSVTVAHADSLQQAVDRAYELTQPGGVVTLCPACASFDMFDDYEHRGRSFKAAVKDLAQRIPQ